MKTAGIFEAKTRLSELCDDVARTGESVLVTRRGKPLVQINPIQDAPLTIRERRATYMAEHGPDERDEDADFEVPDRSAEMPTFQIEER